VQQHGPVLARLESTTVAWRVAKKPSLEFPKCVDNVLKINFSISIQAQILGDFLQEVDIIFGIHLSISVAVEDGQ
jgi:hypothetical protein